MFVLFICELMLKNYVIAVCYRVSMDRVSIKGRDVSCRTAGFNTFPDYLVLHMRKFVMEAGWVPKKLGNTPITIYLSINAAYCNKGIQMIKSIRDCFGRELLAQHMSSVKHDIFQAGLSK
jgi:hypothetical protein